MARIEKSYENKFRAILGQVKPRDFDKAMEWLRRRAEQVRREHSAPSADALAQVYEKTRQRLACWGQKHRRGTEAPAHSCAPTANPPRFLCDAGLGGLARWLRAAGYQAFWIPDIDDDRLLQEARRLAAILLTTDSGVMERRLVREGMIRALWVSPALKILEQLKKVLRELQLPLRESRCMSCGGALVRAEKEAWQGKIPPKTFRWLDKFFVCEECGQLFWHGTHWRRIRAQLEAAEPAEV